MASWVIFALLSPLFFAVVALVDKFIVDRRVKNSYSLAMASGLVLGSYAVLLLLLRPLQLLSLGPIALASGSGVLFAGAVIVYLKALQTEEVSRAIPLLYLLAIVAAVLEMVFLGGRFPAHFFVAVTAMVAGAILLSVKDFGDLRSSLLHPSPGKFLLLLSAFLFGAQAVAEKASLAYLPHWNVYSVQFITYGAVLSLLAWSKENRANFAQLVADRVLPLIVVNESMALLAIMLFLMAATATKVAYVSALGVLEPFYILVFSVILSRFLPQLHQESRTAKEIAFKAGAVLMIISGGVAIALGL